MCLYIWVGICGGQQKPLLILLHKLLHCHNNIQITYRVAYVDLSEAVFWVKLSHFSSFFPDSNDLLTGWRDVLGAKKNIPSLFLDLFNCFFFQDVRENRGGFGLFRLQFGLVGLRDVEGWLCVSLCLWIGPKDQSTLGFDACTLSGLRGLLYQYVLAITQLWFIHEWVSMPTIQQGWKKSRSCRWPGTWFGYFLAFEMALAAQTQGLCSRKCRQFCPATQRHLADDIASARVLQDLWGWVENSWLFTFRDPCKYRTFISLS